MKEISQTVGDLSHLRFNIPDDYSSWFATPSHACFFLFALTVVFAEYIIQHRETSYCLCEFFLLIRGLHVIWTALGGPENWRFFPLCFRLRQSSFHWTISDGVISGVERNWERSDSSYSNSVERMTSLTTPIFKA